MLYAVVAGLSALWMWFRSSGMIVASNRVALIDIALVSWAMVYRGGGHHECGDN